MHSKSEHFLILLMEECAEIQQRASKALRFGMMDIPPGESCPNKVLLVSEINDLLTVIEMMRERQFLPPSSDAEKVLRMKKEQRILAWMEFSQNQSCLDDGRSTFEVYRDLEEVEKQLKAPSLDTRHSTPDTQAKPL